VSWLDSDTWRVGAYLLVAALSVVAGLRDRRLARANPDLWPTFWFITAALFLAMGVGRMGHVAEFVADLGRRQAAAAGWYDNRRTYQAMVVGSVAATWLVVVVVSLWRVPERRRRYLPMALLSFTIVCFAGIRMVSLHHIDSLLYEVSIAGARFNAWIEAALLLAAIALTFWQPRPLEHPTGSRASGGDPASTESCHNVSSSSRLTT
jgi:hypothetical protein